MKPCCSLLTPLSPREAREDILALSVAEGEGPRVLDLPGGGLAIRWHSTDGRKPLLGFPRWTLDIHSSTLGTVVDFRWMFPWRRAIILTGALWIPGLIAWLWPPYFSLSGIFLILGSGFTLFALWGHLGTRRGLQWKNLRALVQEQIQGM